MSIPKIIHYCWFGKTKLDELSKRCIESWKNLCPDYQIIEWNESNFDITSNDYVKEAYNSQKWAFVSDYVRLYALNKFGGIYMDTDVEIIKSFDSFLNCKAFIGFENENFIETAVMASEKDGQWVKNMLSYYDEAHFLYKNGEIDTTTNVAIITKLVKDIFNVKIDNTFQENEMLTIYPKDYFSPKDFYTKKLSLTNNTVAIHHFNASWQDDINKMAISIRKYFKPFFSEKWAAHFAKIVATIRIKGLKKAGTDIFDFIKKGNS